MNKIKSLIAMLALAGALASPISLAQDDEQLEAVRAKITGMFDTIKPESIGPGPIDGWYTIQQGAVVAYVSEDARYLLQGEIIDLETRANLTDMARNDVRREVLAKIGDDDVIAFTPEEVRHTVTVFTDVDCTYCRRLHSQIEDYMSQGIEVRYLLYPRNGPASSSWTTAEQVWCAQDRNGALTAAKADQEFETSECDASMVQDHYVLGREVGLSGTPAIVLEDGTLIGGYMPPEQLARTLEPVPEAEAGGDAGN
jgi:thiol:disulfide interchange protein DsbC